MKHLKLYERFELDEDPWGEDTPRDRTFWDWFREKYPNKNPEEIKDIDCSNQKLTSLKS